LPIRVEHRDVASVDEQHRLVASAALYRPTPNDMIL
jgi:hypothetical protein